MIPEVLTPSAEMHLYLKVFNLVHLFPFASVCFLCICSLALMQARKKTQ